MTSPRSDAGTFRPLDAALFLLAAGLLVGLLDGAWYAYLRAFRHEITFIPPEAIWIAPLVYAGLYLLLGAPVALLGALRPRWAPPSVLAGLVLGLTMATVLFIATGTSLSTVALVLLSLGVAIRGGQWLGRPALARMPAIRRLAAALALVVLALAGVRLVRQRLSPARGATPGTPNVLLIILDTVRASSLSLYGHDRPTTPRMEAFARGGVVFDSAMSVTSWTLPAHGTIFTGQYHQAMTTDWLTPLDHADRVLAEAFRDAGYHTAGFAANLAYTTRESGLARGFEYYRDYLRTPGQAWLDCSLCAGLTLRWTGSKRFRRDNVPKHGRQVSREFLQWLDARKPGRFFVFLNYFDAHLPRPAIPKGSPWDTGDRLRDRYDHSIHLLDDYVGDLMDSLSARGVLDSTIVIIASDHGEMLGEHGLKEHGNGLYLPVLHVPLILRGPGIPAGVRVGRPISLRDLAETIRGAAGLPAPAFPGVSLAPLWQGDSAFVPSPLLTQIIQGINTPPSDPVTRGTMNGVIRGDLHYILGGDGKEELFRLSADPGEERNLAGEPAAAAALDSVRAELRVLLTPGWKGSQPVPAAGAPAQGGR